MDIYSTTATVSAISPALLIQIQECRKKYNQPSPPHDPLAIDKIKVARYLEKFGLTLDDLPPEFWTHDEELRGFILGQIVGPVMAERRAAKRAALRLKRLIAVGYPTDYYSRPIWEQRRISAAVRARRWRAKQPTVAPPIAPRAVRRAIPFELISPGWHTDKLALLFAYTAGDSARARKLRGREPELTKAALVYQVLMREFQRQPSLGDLAARLGCSRAAAQNRAGLLVHLYAAGGPWHQQALRGVSDTEPRGVSDKAIETAKEMVAGRGKVSDTGRNAFSPI